MRVCPQLYIRKNKEKIIISDPKSSMELIEVRCMDKKLRRFISADKEVKCLECERSFGELTDGLSNKRLSRHLCKWKGY